MKISTLELGLILQGIERNGHLLSLGCSFKVQSDQRSKNKVKLITDEFVVDFHLYMHDLHIMASVNYKCCLPITNHNAGFNIRIFLFLHMRSSSPLSNKS